ncbi:MAG: hypothetical protein WD063_19590 [Pirellulales bacterium]
MKYAACVVALGLVAQAAPAVGQVVYESVPEVVYEAPAVPVTTYYAPAVPARTYYAPLPVARYYSPYYAPGVRVYNPARYYVPPRAARRWYRNSFYSW